MTGVGAPLALAPMHPRVVVLHVVVSLAARTARAEGIEKIRELAIGDFITVDEKLRQVYFVLRPLVFGTVVVAHQKRSSRNAHHRTRIFGAGRCATRLRR